MFRLKAILLFLVVLLGSPVRAEEAADLQALRSLLLERLGLMGQVAAFKWNKGLAIDDPVREANVLKASEARARAAGLPVSRARTLVVAQMEAAKMVQHAYFGKWRAEDKGAIPNTPDLAEVLRPKIGALSGRLIEAVSEQKAELKTCLASSVLQPVPDELSHVPEAWNMAVSGVLVSGADCP